MRSVLALDQDVANDVPQEEADRRAYAHSREAKSKHLHSNQH